MQRGYLDLKLSWELFKKAPETLSPPELKRLSEVATRQQSIEQSILASTDAANVIVPAETLAARIAEIRQRYESEEEFIQNLAHIGIRQSELMEAVERDTRVEAVLEKIASDAEEVSVIDAEIYYHLHPSAFDRPEARRLRHILVTFEGVKSKAKASAQLETLRTKLNDANSEAFGAAALRTSQCPTAMEGGQLGVVKRRQLYPELEPAAFALAANEISTVLESPIGLHILRCDEILPSGMLPFAEVQEKIISRLFEIRRKTVQREWIKDRLSTTR